jgi:hypothetical protein
VSEQLHVFGEAFAEIFRLEAPVEVSYYYVDTPNASGLRGGASVSVPVEVSPQHLCEALPDAVTITGARATFAVRAAMRDWHGAVDWNWIAGAGRVWVSANLHQRVAVYDVAPGAGAANGAPWHARVFVDVLSLFRLDNQEVLDSARRLWSELRAEHPGMTDFFDALPEGEEVPHAGIVTLAVPPPGTPRDNRELYEANEPKLRTAVTRWEQATGNPFQWTES